MFETWNKALEVLRTRLDPVQFETWVSPIHAFSGTDGGIVLEVPDEFFAGWVRNNYLDIIKEAVWDTARRHVGIDFKIAALREEPASAEVADSPAGSGDGLVPRYTFERFVVGPSNEIAHSACEMVAANPASTYNPLFIYGGVGLGKTHLLHAVGHAIRQAFPAFRILHLSGEAYVNEVMTAIKNQRLDVLRYKHRGQCDVFLVDDVHYLAGRDFAQEEFFHTFNELYNAGRQIVITSDQFPNALPKVSERLRSRFEWGLIVDIAPPEPELRVSILREKARREGIDLPEDVAVFLAQRFSSSVRELEGALNRVTAYALIRKVPLSLDLAHRVTERILTDRKGRLTPDIILKMVADYFQLQVPDLKSPRRTRGVSLPRQIAACLLRRHTSLSLPDIGRQLGNRSHTTIMSGLNHLDEVLASDPAVERAIKDLERQLGV